VLARQLLFLQRLGGVRFFSRGFDVDDWEMWCEGEERSDQEGQQVVLIDGVRKKGG
jgi:hypothetical protein